MKVRWKETAGTGAARSAAKVAEEWRDLGGLSPHASSVLYTKMLMTYKPIRNRFLILAVKCIECI